MKNPCKETKTIEERLICYFNIMDICVAYIHYDNGKEIKFALSFCEKYIIDSGIYLIPIDVCPLGRNAEQLIEYGIKEIKGV